MATLVVLFRLARQRTTFPAWTSGGDVGSTPNKPRLQYATPSSESHSQNRTRGFGPITSRTKKTNDYSGVSLTGSITKYFGLPRIPLDSVHGKSLFPGRRDLFGSRFISSCASIQRRLMALKFPSWASSCSGTVSLFARLWSRCYIQPVLLSLGPGVWEREFSFQEQSSILSIGKYVNTAIWHRS